MREQIIALLERHCRTITQEAALIGQSIGKVTIGMEREDLEPSVRHVHKIKGSSGSLGFPSVSRAAQALEDRLRGIGRVDGTALAQIEDMNARLQEAVCRITPETSTLHQKFKEADK
ncbi:Hpt domain-containing protein [Jannaschia donghaensis]|uniref:Hpt domain protein n=1 Tax=Jannaschia donghaensis TaxID=420998 RepID=A0A0M6YM83_9RHOB|nr:Hpt domain-containing protein [Jannaschia donghaensis]CTQ50623.1 Hpt domain protein [Jannaschia donghaensis]